MKKLDLHGVKYEDACRQLIRFIEDNWGKDEEVEIITGNSGPMKEVTKSILDEYGLKYRVGDPFGYNNGYIKTTIT